MMFFHMMERNNVHWLTGWYIAFTRKRNPVFLIAVFLQLYSCETDIPVMLIIVANQTTAFLKST